MPNDEKPIGLSLSTARTLVGEIERLKGEVDRLEGRVRHLASLAYQDPLVNLPNRRRFLDDLDKLLDRVQRYDESAAMIFVDVDGLKRINDQFGHTAGDAALVEVARILVESARKSDLVARLSGDEFGILMLHADELTAWQMALRVVETAVGAQFCVGDQCLPLSVSVGVGMVLPGDDANAVIARADKAMYRVKVA